MPENGQNGSGVVTPVRCSTVSITAIVYNDQPVSLEIVLQHGPGDDDAKLLGVALSLLRQNGGILVDANGALDFFPLMSIKKLTLRMNRIQAANAVPKDLGNIRLQ